MAKKYLIIVDMQNDFCTAGSLAVAGSNEIIRVINKISTSGFFNTVIATQDWHPVNHISFASRHGLEPFTQVTKPDFSENVTVWPDHCIQNLYGSKLHIGLDQSRISFLVRKGMNKDIDSYSAFKENDRKTATGLHRLIERGSDIYIVGIATDVCVIQTALDALSYGYGYVHVIEDACVGVTPKGTKAAINRMKTSGINIIKSSDIKE